VAVNPVTNKAYVANVGSNNVTVITEAATQAIPLTTTITPLAGNRTTTGPTTFSLSASSTFSPNAPAVQGVKFQVDTWQGPWAAATPTGGGNFSATTPALQPGLHTLFAYATDAQAATSTNTGSQSSLLVGAIAAYTFVVVPPVPTTTTVTSSANPSVFGQAVTFTAKVCPSSGTTAPTGSVQFVVDGANFGSPVTPGSGVPTNCTAFTSSSISTLSISGSPHTVAAAYTPADTSFTGSQGSLPGGQVVNKASTTTAVSASPNPVPFGSPVTITATVSANAPATGTPTGTVQFKNGSANLGPAQPLNGSGVATLTISTLLPNQTITAVYGGDTNFSGGSGTVSPGVSFDHTSNGAAGNLTLSGGSWLVTGRVGGTLTIGAGTSVAIMGASTGGGIVSTNGGAFALCATSVGSSLQVSGATGFVVVGDPGDDGCTPNTFGSSVSLTNNAAGAELGSNRVQSSVTFNNNTGGGPYPSDATPHVEANVIASSLSCNGNSPAPSNEGHPNSAPYKLGQCAAL
jgi:hypothetical protein